MCLWSLSIYGVLRRCRRARNPSWRYRMQISANSRMRLRAIQMLPGWCCSFLRLDQPVCGGPPQLSNSWLGTQTGRCACWLFGSRYWQPIGGRQAGVRWREFQTGGYDSFGTPSTSWQVSCVRLQRKNPRSQNRAAVFRKGSIGMKRSFTRRTRAGRMSRLQRFGTAQLCELFRDSGRRFATSLEGKRCRTCTRSNRTIRPITS